MRQRSFLAASIAAFFLPVGRQLHAQITAQSTSPTYVTNALAAHYVALADSAAAAPAARALWQTRLDASRDTIDHVIAWYVSHGRGDEALRLLIPLGRFWRGPSIVSAFDTALGLPGTAPAIRARALNTAAAAAFRVKDQARTRRWATESIVIWRSLGDSAQAGRAYERLVQVALRDGNHVALRALADTGDMLCVQAHDDDCHAYFLNMRGESARVLKQYDSATVFYDQSGNIYSRLSPVVRLDILHNMGFALLAGGHQADAGHRFREGLNHAVATADRSYYAGMLAGLASCEAVRGNAAVAGTLFGVSDAQLERLGIVADPADAVEYERYRAIARAKLGTAAFDSVTRIGRRLPVDSVIATLK